MSTCVNVTFIMPEITELAENRAKATKESFINWHDALSKGIELANNAKIDPDAFLLIANNSITFSQFLLIMESLSEYSKENPYGTNAFNLLIYYANCSAYSLRDWFEVLDYFYSWLSKNCRQASLETILCYVLGCVRGKNWIELSNCNLIEIVEKMLGTYGFQD